MSEKINRAEWYDSKDEWYEALLAIAKTHGVEHLVRDKDGWTYNWENETPSESFYNDYPQYLEAEDPLCR